MADASLAAGVRLTRTPTPRSRFEAGIKIALVAASLLSVVTTVCIVGSLLFETLSFFGEVPVTDFLFGTKWSPTFAGEQASFGVLPLLWGTLYLSLIALLVAVPLGLLSRDLPVRVRAPARAQGHQADARAARRRPDDRLRLLRPDVLHADDPAGARHRGGRVQRPLGGA